jgi:dolichol-phosphate mannosyltransferase
VAGLFLTACGVASSGRVFYQANVLRTTDRGWSSLVCLQLLFSGAILTALGLVGDYVARIYEEVKGRPLYVLAEQINIAPDAIPPAGGMRLHIQPAAAQSRGVELPGHPGCPRLVPANPYAKRDWF